MRDARPHSPAFIDVPAFLSSASNQALLADPALSALTVEYACWELALADWHARQRRKRDPEYPGWIAEGRALFDRLDELKKVAHGCRLNVDSAHRARVT
jgi:hypothetical protein